MAVVKGEPVPIELREAQVIVESGGVVSLEQYDNLPLYVAERIMIYQRVKAAKLMSDW